MSPIYDPPEPPEGGGIMRAKDLVNRSCLFRPTALGEWPAKRATEHEPAQKAQTYIECDVWVLDRQGVAEEGTAVRVGWWKAVNQLRERMGQLVAAKPRHEDGSNAIYLAPLAAEAREVAAKVAAELEAVEPQVRTPGDPSRTAVPIHEDALGDYSDEPF